ncbi:metallophosphoesterase family protein [Pinibacter aurantiacus]|uniref:Metallophosphoesterase n=1 Tax=Pinibacter aurantiacus TaxID=2851599 RepID=A0A9E2W9M3_9BACT|nr:metallophosphoesterase [Pinibacter aurantiacus]MBV4359912.1 metallophosphoesterase [Pinibacter aurantiacus]
MKNYFLATLLFIGFNTANYAQSVTSVTTTAQKPDDVKFDFICHPYLQNMTTSGVSIFWLMNKNCTSWIEFGETQALGKKAVNSANGQIDANSEIQKVAIENLVPGKTYYYRTASKSIVKYESYNVVFKDTVYSELYTFTLPAEKVSKFSFLVFGDVHNKCEYIKEVMTHEKDFDFVIFNGDVVADIMSEKQIYGNFLDKISGFFAAQKPFIYERGNHETRGGYTRSLLKYFDYPANHYYHNFLYGNTNFTFLDCGEDKEDNKYESYFGLADYDAYRKKQAEWYSSLIQTKEYKKAVNRIICSHIPIYKAYDNDKEGGGDWHGASDLRDNFLPLFQQTKIDLMLNGHTHMPRLLTPAQAESPYFVAISGSPIYENYSTPKRFTAYTLVEINGSKITVTLKKPDGSIIDKAEVK